MWCRSTGQKFPLPTSDPNIHLTIPYAFHFRYFFSIIHPSIFLFLPPLYFSYNLTIGCYEWIEELKFLSMNVNKQDWKKRKTQEIKKHPGGTEGCITLLRSWSFNYINEDNKYSSIYQISSTIQRNYFIFFFPFPIYTLKLIWALSTSVISCW